MDLRWVGLGFGFDRLQATCCAVVFFFVADKNSFGVGANSLLCKVGLSCGLFCGDVSRFLSGGDHSFVV